MLILLIRLRTETASEHTLSCTPGQAGRTLNLFKLRGCQVGEETQTPTPRDGHDDDDEAKGGRARLCCMPICHDPVSVTIWSWPRESSVDSSNY